MSEEPRAWTLLDELKARDRWRVCGRCSKYVRLGERAGECHDRQWVYHTTPDATCARFTVKASRKVYVRRDETCDGCAHLVYRGAQIWVCRRDGVFRRAWNGFPGRRCDDWEEAFEE